MSTPTSARHTVRIRANDGSPFHGDTFLNTPMSGRRLSLAIACNNLGALEGMERDIAVIISISLNNTHTHTCTHTHTRYPVSVCRPAPIVDSNAPIRTIHFVGQASNATVSAPVLSPNLMNNSSSRGRRRRRRRRRRRMKKCTGRGSSTH